MGAKVSVICTCFNHKAFVIQAIESVLAQSYPNVELVVVDSGSTDGSQTVIEEFCLKREIPFYFFWERVWLPKAFNWGLARTSGKYVIDFSADDVMLPQKLEKQVVAFENLPENYALIYSDAWLIDENLGRKMRFYENLKAHSGDVYEKLIARNFICTPTVMYRRKALEELGGFDESLTYEDFDVFTKLARNYLFFYQDEALIMRRLLKKSSKNIFFESQNPHLVSTLKIFENIIRMNKNEAENWALSKTIRYHFRQAVLTKNKSVAKEFYQLLDNLQKTQFSDYLFLILNKLPFSLSALYVWFQRIR